MENVKMLETNRTESRLITDFDCNKYRKQSFGMFSGVAEEVTLEFDQSLIDVIFDKFGQKTHIGKYNDKYRAKVEVVPSSQFFGFIVGLGDRIKITIPEGIVEGLRYFMARVNRMYKKEELAGKG